MATPRTLLFCTAYADSFRDWPWRYEPWLRSVRASGIECDQILLIDDCSPFLPGWPGLAIAAADAAAPPPDKPLVLVTFPTHLGKIEGLARGHALGWFRSFGYALHYARAGGFVKLVHVESDAFVISRRLAGYINALDTGWNTLWCPQHRFPEDNIQVIGAAAFALFDEFAGRPYAAYADDDIERQYPFTHVERRFVGDRYGEYRPDIPREADYGAQARMDDARPADYFWWLPREAPPEALRGHLDLAEPARISGWVQDMQAPEAPVTLEIYAGGIPVGTTVADRYRADLQAAGIGSGRHCFDFTPPPGADLAARSVQLRRIG